MYKLVNYNKLNVYYNFIYMILVSYFIKNIINILSK